MQLIYDVLQGKSEFEEQDVKELADQIIGFYNESKNVVPIPSNHLIFVGDIHGELGSVRAVAKEMEKRKKHHVVFLGDYADRGPEQLESVMFVFALKILYPNRVTLLRGNHESEQIAGKYGFYYDTIRKVNSKAFYYIMEAYQVLPIAAISKSGIFACHGGVPEGVKSLEDINSCSRYNPDFPEDIIFQMVWNDPQEGDFGFRPNMRSGRARTYGKKAFDEFTGNLGIEIMFRAHEVFPHGIQHFFNQRLVSVFSASYRGQVKPKLCILEQKNEVLPINIEPD